MTENHSTENHSPYHAQIVSLNPNDVTAIRGWWHFQTCSLVWIVELVKVNLEDNWKAPSRTRQEHFKCMLESVFMSLGISYPIHQQQPLIYQITPFKHIYCKEKYWGGILRSTGLFWDYSRKTICGDVTKCKFGVPSHSLTREWAGLNIYRS